MIVTEFVKWLKSKRAYSEYVKEFNIGLHSNLNADDVENVKKVLLELASSIYNLMEIFPFHSTKKDITIGLFFLMNGMNI